MTENTVVDDIEYAIERASDYCNNSTEWFGEDSDAAFNAIIRPVLDAARKELTALAARVAELEASAVELREIREALERLHDVTRDCGVSIPFATDNTIGRAIEVMTALYSSEQSAQSELADVVLVLPGTRFMDPSDGGSPSIATQVGRMADALATAQQRVAELERERDEVDRVLAALRDTGNAWLRAADSLVSASGLDIVAAENVTMLAHKDALRAALAAAARAATNSTPTSSRSVVGADSTATSGDS